LDDLPVPLQEGQKIILYFSGLNCLFNFSFSLFIITAKKKSQIPLPPVNPLLSPLILRGDEGGLMILIV